MGAPYCELARVRARRMRKRPLGASALQALEPIVTRRAKTRLGALAPSALEPVPQGLP